ncbi:MAG: SurA N-terminal domain-containing protein [Helicobacteraceae bacterium]|nr:SurA N-terminal domain-containing protein [Helicobacteraceae bacterium]
MITWMQQHKKYLIITIWISTIAFIAAGMVGWGAYNFSHSTNSVASVGNIDISVEDFNMEYNNIFREYSKQLEELTGRPLDNEQAKTLGLENVAMTRAINKALLENFAIDSGIRISDEEVTKEIQNDEIFRQNGIFSPKTYKEILAQNRIRPLEYERMIRKELLIKKILSMFPSIVTPSEGDVLNLSLNLQDKLSVQIINANQVKVNIEDSKLMEFYNKNKESYKSPKQFEVEMLNFNPKDIKPNENDVQTYYNENKQNYTENGILQDYTKIKDKVENDFKIWRANRNALEAYVEMKQNKNQNNRERKIILEGDNKKIVEALQNANEGETIQPLEVDDEFVALKLIKRIPQTIRTFDEVKDKVKNNYYPQALREALQEEAKARINVFNGKDIGYFSLNDVKQIPSLSPLESREVLRQIFENNDKVGYAILGNKAVLYNIMEQKVLTNQSSNLDIFRDFKSIILEQSLFDFLSKEYKIINNLKKDS